MYVRGASNGLTVIHNAGFLTAITLNIAITSQLRFTNAIETALNKRERVKAYTRTFKPNKWAHVCVRNWQQAVTAIFCHLPRNHRRELTLKAPRIQAGKVPPSQVEVQPLLTPFALHLPTTQWQWQPSHTKSLIKKIVEMLCENKWGQVAKYTLCDDASVIRTAMKGK